MGKKKVQKLVFDEDSRREFVTGFQKRKLARKKKAAEEFEQQLKEAKKQMKDKIRETYKKVIRPVSTDTNDDVEEVDDIDYELPEHIVKVKELLPDDIVEQHNWIGRNRMRIENEENQNNRNSDSEASIDELIPGMAITSMKQVKKIVTNQASSLMQNSEVFKKKNKLEKLKNRKKAALRRNLLKKEQKKLKGRKRK